MGDGVWEAMTPEEQKRFLRGDRSMVSGVEARVAAARAPAPAPVVPRSGFDPAAGLVEAQRVLDGLGGVLSAADVLAGLPVEDAAVTAGRREVLEAALRK